MIWNLVKNWSVWAIDKIALYKTEAPFLSPWQEQMKGPALYTFILMIMVTTALIERSILIRHQRRLSNTYRSNWKQGWWCWSSIQNASHCLPKYFLQTKRFLNKTSCLFNNKMLDESKKFLSWKASIIYAVLGQTSIPA